MLVSKIIFLLLLIPIMFTGCINTSGLKATYPLGREYSDTINISNKDIPLPDGNWKIIGSGYAKDDKYFEVKLIKTTDDNQIDSFVNITSETITNNYISYTNKYCERTDIHYVNAEKNSQDGLDCLAVNHFRMSMNGKSTADKEAYDFIRANGYVMPKNMILGYHIITGFVHKNSYLKVSHLVNPEVDGFNPPKEAHWSSSDWHPLQINNDPKKVKYIEDFKSSSSLYHKKIQGHLDN